MPDDETPLESWKAIAAHLQKDVTTVRRWEKKEGLPVHRHSHHSRSSVYAYATEIDAWRASRSAAVEAPAPPPRWWSALATPGFALAVLLCLILVGNGVRPVPVLAQQLGQTRTMICAGSDCGDGRLSPDIEALLIQSGVRPAPNKVVQAVLPFGSQGRLSPDGSRIAYSPMVTEGNFKNIAPTGEVIVSNTDGSNSRTIYHGGIPLAWSPDAKRLLVVSGEPLSQMVWVDAGSGSVQKLAPHWGVQKPVISPDGKYIAFSGATDRTAIENVIVMTSDGSKETAVSPSPAYQAPVGWTPDGKNLIYLQYGGPESLWSVEIAGGRVQGPPVHVPLDLGKDGRVLGISRSGAMLYATTSSSRDIYTASMDPSTGRVTSAPALLPLLRTGVNSFPRWSPDSQRLLFMTSDDGKRESALRLYSFVTVSSGESQEEPVPAAVETLLGFCWSTDGTAVYGNAEGKALQFVRVGLADGKVAPVLGPPTSARPEIFQLAGCSGDLAVGRGKSGLQVRSLVDGSTREIYPMTPDGGLAAVAISHDGRTVAFTSGKLDRGMPVPPSEIHIVSTNGGPVRDLPVATGKIRVMGLAWSPDDRSLYFTQGSNAHSPIELLRVPSGGGTVENAGLKFNGLGDISIAPDGRRIAFSAGSGGTQVWAVQGFLPVKK